MTALIGGILLAAGVVLFILEPVISGHRAPLYEGDDLHDESAARRRVALTALRDLEYDRATGKLDDADYQRLKVELSKEALLHLREPDAVDGPRELASQELEEEIARIRLALQEGTQCAACGHVSPAGAHFCGQCGTALEVADTVGAGP